MVWTRSSFCADASCIEVAEIDELIAVRDSKDTKAPILLFTKVEWNNFRTALINGEIELP
jgi:hypothetical protein